MERSYSRCTPGATSCARIPASAYNPDYVSRSRTPTAPKARASRIPPRSRPHAREGLRQPPSMGDRRAHRSQRRQLFTKGIDRAYPDKWAKSYPSYNLLRNVEG